MGSTPDNPSGPLSLSSHWSGSGLTSFVGRAVDLARVQALLVDPAVRLVTLTGPGGVGKTRLAEELVARLHDQFSDGVLFVELSAVSNPALFASAILRSLGGEQEPAVGDIDTLVARLQSRSLLLVLDNMEQLLDSAKDVQQLLVRSPGVTCLVTSRALLLVRGEFEYVVEPLAASNDDTSPAVQLLQDRTRAALPANRSALLTTELAAQICSRVDGLPLAIELAAAQLRILAPDDLLSRLGGTAGMRGRGPRDLPDRQSTMESTVAWSFELLSEELQDQLAMLSVFTGGFSLEAGQILLGHDSDTPTIETVQALIANSLVRTSVKGESVRFSMLETIRAYGLQKLAERGVEAAVREKHAGLFRMLAEREGPRLRAGTDEQLRIWVGIEADIANYRSAVEWFVLNDRYVEAASIVSGLDWFWTDSNYVAEGLRLITPLAESPQLLDEPTLRSRTLRVQTGLADMLGQFDILEDLIERALEAAKVAGDINQIPELYHLASGILIDQGQLGAARSMARKTSEAAREQGKTWFVGAGELNLALIEVLDGDFTAALAANKRGLEAFQECGDRDLEHSAIITSGLAWLLSGDYPKAQETYQSVLNRQLQRIEESFFFQQVSRGIASVVTRTGRPELAARIFGMSDAEYERTGVTLRKPLQALFETYRSDVRQVLGTEAYEEAWQGGFALSKTDAVIELNALAAPPKPVDRKLRPAPFNLLSNREFEVLQYLVAGKTDPEIANALFLSPRTVSQHVSNILSKLQVSSRTAAATMASRIVNA